MEETNRNPEEPQGNQNTNPHAGPPAANEGTPTPPEAHQEPQPVPPPPPAAPPQPEAAPPAHQQTLPPQPDGNSAPVPPPVGEQAQPAPAAAPVQPATAPAAVDPVSAGASRYSQHESNPELEKIRKSVDTVRNEIEKVIIGQDRMIDLLLVGLFTGGHVLLEGVPGIAKTLTAKSLARTLSADFSRIQFTPDLMPTDIIGTQVFNMKDSEFVFNKGPIFSNVILIDEINRSPAKTQAALMEVMEERQITVDGNTFEMEFPFLVVATQNPVEQEGTYKLPEAQLDRFLFRIKLHYPGLEDEIAILKRFSQDFSNATSQTVSQVFSPEDIRMCQAIIEKIYIKDELIAYIGAIVHNTRNNGDLYLGASPRASLSILRASKAIAAMNGRDFVTPDDIRYVAEPVLNHRIILSPEREMEGIEVEDVINDILKKIEVPR